MSQTLALRQPFSLNLDEIGKGNPETREVVAELYVKLRPALVSYVYHLLGSTRDGEDVVQMTFLQLFDQLNENSQIPNVRGWLCKVTRNLAIGLVRKDVRREALFSEWASENAQSRQEESAEDRLLRQESIRTSLALLNEREQHCLMLRSEGFSYQEIAEVLDTPLSRRSPRTVYLIESSKPKWGTSTRK